MNWYKQAQEESIPQEQNLDCPECGSKLRLSRKHHKLDIPGDLEERQTAKEEAVLLALQKDMALIRRDLKIYGMKKDGSTVLISESQDYDKLWQDALQALKKKF